MQRFLFAALAAVVIAAPFAGAAPFARAADDDGKVYRFGSAEKHTNIAFTSEADVENIYGMTHVASGTTWINLVDLKGKASITIPVKSMKTGIDVRDEHLRSETWLDEAKYPSITLTSDGFDLTVKNKDKGIFDAKFVGEVTIHGVKKKLETTAKVVQVSEKSAKLMGDGSWVRVTASFDVKLSEFGIKIPDGPVQGKVNDTWSVKFDCYATTATE